MNVTCSKCGFVDAGQFCSQCGTGLRQQPPARRIASVLAAPIYEYLKYSKSILQPARLVDDIKAGRFDAYDLLSFLVASATLSAVVEYFFPAESLIPNPVPVVGEALTALLMMIGAGTVNAPLHFYFNAKSKRVSFSKFLIASAAMTALFFPWLTLFGGLGEALDVKNASMGASYGTLVLAVQTYSLLYERSRGSIVTGLVIYMVTLGLALFAVIMSMI